MFEQLSAGLLPKWLLFVSAVSVFNSAQCYLGGPDLTRRVYPRQPDQVTSLSVRTFGTWTFLSCVIRMYAALNITNSQVYDLAIASYLIAGFHFVSEWLVFHTTDTRKGSGLYGPLVVASLSATWMLTQRSFYAQL